MTFSTLSGNAQGMLCTTLLLLLCAGLGVTLRAMACRAPRALCLHSVLPCVLCAALLCVLMNGRAQGFDAPGALPFTGAAGRLSPCTLTAGMAAMAAVLALALLRLRAWRRDHLSAASVKEGLDQLPAGLCFYVRDGLPRLVNMRMDALCCALTGSPLMNGEVFWHRLCAGDVAPGCEALATGDAPILRTPDGRVWSFARSGIRVDGQSAQQIVASDVTQEHAMNQQLHEDNLRVAQLNLRLRRYGAQIRELTREKETLAARVRIHDDFGQALLAARRLGAQQGNAQQREQVLALWRINLALLCGTGEKEPPAAGLGALVEAARAVGVTVTAEGPQPAADSPAAALLLHAAHECLTNTVRHAGGTALHISLERDGGCLRAVLTNDGRAPDGPVREGSGLCALRRQVEAAGGRMRIESTPRFALILELNRQEA